MTTPEDNEKEIVFDEELAEDDYAFIFDVDGELKQVFLPDGFELNPPEVIKKILAVLGIDDINSNWLDENQQLH